MRNEAIAGIFAVLALTATVAGAGPGGHAGADWRAEMEEVDAKLVAGKWKSGKRAARKLAEEILAHGWHDRQLKQILAELAFFQAAAAANLGQNEEAIWYWFVAQNVDFKIREKDLAPYGETGKRLLAFPPRQRGRAPPSFQVAEPRYGRFTRAVLSHAWSPVMPYNSAAHRERPGDVHVELIIDRHGRPHHPVILTHVHPVVTYGILDALRGMPFLEPARDSGEPVASLFKYVISPTYSRWNQGGKTFRGKIE